MTTSPHSTGWDSQNSQQNNSDASGIKVDQLSVRCFCPSIHPQWDVPWPNRRKSPLSRCVYLLDAWTRNSDIDDDISCWECTAAIFAVQRALNRWRKKKGRRTVEWLVATQENYFVSCVWSPIRFLPRCKCFNWREEERALELPREIKLCHRTNGLDWYCGRSRFSVALRVKGFRGNWLREIESMGFVLLCSGSPSSSSSVAAYHYVSTPPQNMRFANRLPTGSINILASWLVDWTDRSPGIFALRVVVINRTESAPGNYGKWQVQFEESIYLHKQTISV